MQVHIEIRNLLIIFSRILKTEEPLILECSTSNFKLQIEEIFTI